MARKKKTTKPASDVIPNEKAPKRTKMPEQLMSQVIDVQFGAKDLADLINLLAVSAQTFELLAKECLKDNNEKAFDILCDRMKLSKDFVFKLSQLHNMGEITSRELH